MAKMQVSSRLLKLLFWALCVVFGRVAAPTLARELVVGMELSYPPFEMTNEKGEPSGISVEMAKALASYLNRPLRIENIPYDGLIPALKTKKIDCILSSMTATEERSKSVAFSDPYLSTGLSLLLNAKVQASRIEDFNTPQKRVVVKKGTTGHQYAVAHLPRAQVQVVDKENAAVLEVMQSKADAFIYDQMSVYQHQKRHPKQLRAVLTPFKKESWAVALRLNDNELRESVNAFLKKFRAEGGFERLGDRFLKEQKEVFKSQKIPFYF